MNIKQRTGRILLWVIAVATLTSCTSTQKRASASLGIGTAVGTAGYVLTEGEDAKTRAAVAAGSAVLGAAVTQLAQGEDPEVLQKGIEAGYDLGAGDATRQLYWAKQQLEKQKAATAAGGQDESGGRVVYYSFTESDKKPKLVPHEVTVPVLETN